MADFAERDEGTLPLWPELAEPDLVRFENVGLRYGIGPEILRDIDFAIPPQSFQFLTGPSGAGKTTLLKLVMQTLKPTRGRVTLFGENVSQHSQAELARLRRKIGIVFQDFRLLDHLTTYENVALPLLVQGREEASYRAEVIELLRWVGLGDRMHVPPVILSGGENSARPSRGRLIGQPALLLADEPTGNVDPGLARRLLRLFIELNKSGTAVVIATHDLALMDMIDARRLVLAEGQLHVYE